MKDVEVILYDLIAHIDGLGLPQTNIITAAARAWFTEADTPEKQKIRLIAKAQIEVDQAAIGLAAAESRLTEAQDSITASP